MTLQQCYMCNILHDIRSLEFIFAEGFFFCCKKCMKEKLMNFLPFEYKMKNLINRRKRQVINEICNERRKARIKHIIEFFHNINYFKE